MKWINRIKEKYENSYINKVKEARLQVRLLSKRVEELEENYKPLINLKNIYLAELRVKNLENGRLRRKLEKLSKYMLECEAGNILFTELNYREVKDIIGGK